MKPTLTSSHRKETTGSRSDSTIQGTSHGTHVEPFTRFLRKGALFLTLCRMFD